MGINGLHSELKPYCRRVHVEKYRGKRLAADGYSWLHKGVYSCASLVAQVRDATHRRARKQALTQAAFRARRHGWREAAERRTWSIVSSGCAPAQLSLHAVSSELRRAASEAGRTGPGLPPPSRFDS
jgi:hypothetical protein